MEEIGQTSWHGAYFIQTSFIYNLIYLFLSVIYGESVRRGGGIFIHQKYRNVCAKCGKKSLKCWILLRIIECHNMALSLFYLLNISCYYLLLVVVTFFLFS